MSSPATCRRCGAPMRSGNARTHPTHCGHCRKASTAEPVPGQRQFWLCGLAAAVAALMLGLNVFVLAGVVYLFKSQPLPTSADDLTEMAAAPALASELAKQPPAQVSRSAPVETAPRQVKVAARRDEPGKAEILPPPRAITYRIVLGPLEEEEKNTSRRNRTTEAELRLQLASAEEVGIGRATSKIYTQYVNRVRKNETGTKGLADFTPIWTNRPDLMTLPMRDGPAAVLAPRAAVELGILSRKLHVYLDAVAPAGPNGRPMSVLRERLRKDLRGKKPEWLRAEAVPTLTQMLMAEDAATRRLLVELLAAIPQYSATRSLAHRAAFDLDADVRSAAAAALKGRDPEVWRPVMIKALRYPWPPPADFAAEALVQLKDQGAVSELVTLLREPRPGRPFVARDRRVVIREVVKINHQHNCVLCHAPALTGKEPVTGLDPIPVTTQVWRSANTGQTGSGQKGGWSAGRKIGSTNTSLVRVRADITFLRQDFSVGFAVANPMPQAVPAIRFDYAVRTRPVQKSERKKWQALEEGNPQRDAVLFALRELTGKDHGDTTEAWVEAFPLADTEVRSVKLANRLLRADPLARGALLQQYRDGAGIEYTWALTRAIGRLSGPPQEVARLALVNRFAKDPAEALRKQLSDSNVEVRGAAVRACAQKNDQSLAPDLISLLDGDAATAGLARAALKKLTGQDLPDAGAWRKWWTGIARAED